MSPSFINDKSHPVRVKDGEGTLRRILAGQTVEADGKFADNLKAAGLSSASSSDERSWESELARRRGDVTDGPARRFGAKLALVPLRLMGRLAVAAPLRRVVGDDAAPLGPPSGTITTKTEAAKESPEARRAFADHEALPGEEIETAGTPAPLLPAAATVTSAEIHNAQARNAEAAEDLLAEMDEIAADTDIADVHRTGGGSPLGSLAPTDEDAEEPPEGDYDEWTGAQLEDELAARELPKSGTNAEKAQRLRDHDAEAAAGDAEQ